LAVGDVDAEQPNRPPKAGAWARFLDQKTTPQRFLLALAALVGAVATIAGAAWVVAGWIDGGNERGVRSDAPHGRLEQGSLEADEFISALLANNEGRVDLDVVVAAPEGTPEGPIYSFISLLYNCRGQAVGSDHCNRARLEFGDVDPPAAVRPPGVHFRGTYAITLRNGTVFGTDVDIVVRDISK